MSRPNQAPSSSKAIKVCMVGAPGSGKSCLVTRLQSNKFQTDLVTVGVSFIPYTIAISKHTLSKSRYDSFLTRAFHTPDHKSPYPLVPQPKQETKSVTNSTSITVVPEPADPEIKHVQCSVWDTAGSDRYAILTKKYYQGAHCCIVCYDLASQESWEKLKTWVQQVLDVEPDTLIIIVGNKKDLITPLNPTLVAKYNLGSSPTPQPRATPINEVKEFAQSVGAVVFESCSKFDGDLASCDTVMEIFTFIAHETAYRQSRAPAQRTNPNRVDLNQKEEGNKSSCC